MLSACLPSLFSPLTSSSAPPMLTSSSSVNLLILGAGWTSTFLIPHLQAQHPSVSFAATTRDGRDGTIEWTWDSESEGPGQYERLPRAETVLVVFPIKGGGGSRRLVEGYEKGDEKAVGGRVRWIQLGSTGIYDGGPTLAADSSAKLKWTDRHSSYDVTNARAIAEDELLSIHEETYVLNLSGLWGGTRDPINWIPRIATSFAALEAKGSLHLIHGEDVARAVVAVHLSPTRSSNSKPEELSDEKSGRRKGERWLLTDLRVYDWWDLVSAWSPPTSSSSSSSPSIAAEHTSSSSLWVQALLRKHNVRSLPRTPEELGRALDSREFWERFELMPTKGRLERGRL